MDMVGQPAEVRFTLTIKRAATGKEEHVEMVGRINPEGLKQLEQEIQHGDNTQQRSA